MVTEQEILQALLGSELQDSLFDGALVSPASGRIILEGGPGVSVTVRYIICQYPSCGEPMDRTVNGVNCCPVHGREYAEFIADS